MLQWMKDTGQHSPKLRYGMSMNTKVRLPSISETQYYNGAADSHYSKNGGFSPRKSSDGRIPKAVITPELDLESPQGHLTAKLVESLMALIENNPSRVPVFARNDIANAIQKAGSRIATHIIDNQLLQQNTPEFTLLYRDIPPIILKCIEQHLHSAENALTKVTRSTKQFGNTPQSIVPPSTESILEAATDDACAKIEQYLMHHNNTKSKAHMIFSTDSNYPNLDGHTVSTPRTKDIAQPLPNFRMFMPMNVGRVPKTTEHAIKMGIETGKPPHCRQPGPSGY